MSPTEKFPERSLKSKMSAPRTAVIDVPPKASVASRSARHDHRPEPVVVRSVARHLESRAVLAGAREREVVAGDEMGQPVRPPVVCLDLEHRVLRRVHELA